MFSRRKYENVCGATWAVHKNKLYDTELVVPIYFWDFRNREWPRNSSRGNLIGKTPCMGINFPTVLPLLVYYNSFISSFVRALVIQFCYFCFTFTQLFFGKLYQTAIPSCSHWLILLEMNWSRYFQNQRQLYGAGVIWDHPLATQRISTFSCGIWITVRILT